MNEKTNNELVETVEEIATEIAFLEHKGLNLKVLANKLNEVIRHINTIEKRPTRDNGPKSTRKLDSDLARSILFGDDKDLAVKEVCQKHGLSYGQVYSVREGYTFKAVQLEFEAYKEQKRNS